MDFIWTRIGHVIHYLVVFDMPYFFTLLESGEKLKIQSTVTGKIYESEECVYILNSLQVYKYLANDAELLDVICGFDNKLAFVFNKKKTYELYDKWCKREL